MTPVTRSEALKALILGTIVLLIMLGITHYQYDYIPIPPKWHGTVFIIEFYYFDKIESRIFKQPAFFPWLAERVRYYMEGFYLLIRDILRKTW